MKRAISFLLLLCAGNSCFAQNTWTARIKDHSTKEPLAGATALLEGSGRGVKADSNGLLAFSNIPDGPQSFSIHFVGYNDHVQTLDFPRVPDTMTIFLFPSEKEMGEVVISSTRSNRIPGRPGSTASIPDPLRSQCSGISMRRWTDRW